MFSSGEQKLLVGSMRSTSIYNSEREHRNVTINKNRVAAWQKKLTVVTYLIVISASVL